MATLLHQELIPPLSHWRQARLWQQGQGEALKYSGQGGHSQQLLLVRSPDHLMLISQQLDVALQEDLQSLGTGSSLADQLLLWKPQLQNIPLARWLHVLEIVQKLASCLPLWQHVQNCLGWWEQAGAPLDVLMLLRGGVKSDVPRPEFLSKKEPPKTVEELEATQKILREYAKSGAVRIIPQQEAKHFIPSFVLSI